jgi:hypothetical protein
MGSPSMTTLPLNDKKLHTRFISSARRITSSLCNNSPVATRVLKAARSAMQDRRVCTATGGGGGRGRGRQSSPHNSTTGSHCKYPGNVRSPQVVPPPRELTAHTCRSVQEFTSMTLTCRSWSSPGPRKHFFPVSSASTSHCRKANKASRVRAFGKYSLAVSRTSRRMSDRLASAQLRTNLLAICSRTAHSQRGREGGVAKTDKLLALRRVVGQVASTAVVMR